jgi:hypothetical protein
MATRIGRFGPSPALYERHPARCVSFHGNRAIGSEISLKFAEIQWGETPRAGGKTDGLC